MTKTTLTGRAGEPLKSYQLNLTRVTSSQLPIWGPMSTYTSLRFQAPLCIKKEKEDSSQGQDLGTFDSSLCNYAVEIEPSKNWTNYEVTQTAPLRQLV